MNLSSIFPSISNILLHNDNFSTSLYNVLKVLGMATKVDRVYLFKIIDEKEQIMNYDAEWCDKGITAEIDNPMLNGIKLSDFGIMSELFEKYSSLSDHVENCPIPEVKPLLEMQDIKSYLWVRLHYNGDFLGFVGFDSCLKKREWHEDEVKILEYLADMVAQSIIRKNAENKANDLMSSLKRQNEFLKQVKEIHDTFLKDPISKLSFVDLLKHVCVYCSATMGFIARVNVNDSSNLEFELMANRNNQPENDWELGISNLLPLLIEVHKGEAKWMKSTTREPLIIQNGEQYDERFRVEGGIPLNNFVGFPVFYGSQLLGVIGLANFPVSLDETVSEDMELVLDVCGNLLHSYKLEAKQAKAQQSILLQRKAFERVFEHTLSGFWDWDLTNNIEFLSRNLKADLGYKENELNNLPSSWIALAHNDDLKQLFHELNQHVKTKGEYPFRQEVRFKHANGHDVHMLVGGSVMEWTKEQLPKRIVGCHVDVSDSAQLEDKLMENLTKERELGKLRSHLVTMVSHEFRTPMSIIQSNAELIRMKIKGSNDQGLSLNISRIERELERMDLLMERVMLMERAKHEFDKRNDQKVDLLKVIDEVMEEYDALPNFNVFNYIQRPNSPLWVCGNLDDLHHVFSNIVSNAFKYGGEKTPEIQFIENTNQVTVIIRDFGVGISEDDIEYVFYPFHRGKNVAGKPGTGLGLAIVYELIEQMGGDIKVKSTEGVSTAFYITIAK